MDTQNNNNNNNNKCPKLVGDIPELGNAVFRVLQEKRTPLIIMMMSREGSPTTWVELSTAACTT